MTDTIPIQPDGPPPEHPKWWLPEWAGPLYIGCHICSTATRHPGMNRRVAGNSDWITRDGELVFGGVDDWDEREHPTLLTFERLARLNPDADWRYIRYEAMHGEVFQRHGRNCWVLIKSNRGQVGRRGLWLRLDPPQGQDTRT